jgi:hypothetical protein
MPFVIRSGNARKPLTSKQSFDTLTKLQSWGAQYSSCARPIETSRNLAFQRKPIVG